MQRILDATFGHPRGILGHIGGKIMGSMAQERNQWTLALLNLRPDDTILEVGSGPGSLLQALAEKIPSGMIMGVDTSPLMIKQATKRNKAALEAGRVDLQEATVESLPFKDETFSKVVSANSVHLWQNRQSGILEIQRVLKTNGLIALVLQPTWAKTDQQVREIGAELVEALVQAGFQQTRLEFHAMKPVSSVCALGTK